MSAAIHSPLRNDSSTRLLILNPGLFDDPIRCRLSEVDLDDNPQYEAISYTWGNEGNQETITVNGVPREIRYNLSLALRRLRHSSEHRTCWVDALSISQEDHDEKGRQVAMIGRIFKHATCVRAWVGEHQDDSEALFREMYAPLASPGLSKKFYLAWFIRLRLGRPIYRLVCGGVALVWAVVALGVATTEPAPLFDIFAVLVVLVALVMLLYLLWLFGHRATQRELWYSVPEWKAFLLRQYWRRTWIIQEAGLARHLIIHCGNDSTSWEKLIDVRLGQIRDSDERAGALPTWQMPWRWDGTLYDESVVFISSLRKQQSQWMVHNDASSTSEVTSTAMHRPSVTELAFRL